MSTSQQWQNGNGNVDTTTLRATGNVIHDERFGNEILARAGPSHQYQRPEYRTHEGIKDFKVILSRLFVFFPV